MPTIDLSDARCRSLTAEGGQPRTDFFDAKVKGLALRVTAPSQKAPRGYKTFTLTYRIGGVQKRFTMEPRFPELGLAEARVRARTMLTDARGGIDPAIPRADARNTFGELYGKFYERLERQPVSAAYLTSLRSGVGKYAVPKWEHRPMISITKGEAVDLVEEIVGAGGPSQANHVVAQIKRVFDYAIDRGVLEASVMAKLKKPAKERRRTRVLDEAELTALWRLAGAMGYPWGPYLRILMLTLQRRSEVSGMPWGELNADRTVWDLPPERRKRKETGNIVPLASAVRVELARCPRLSGVFAFVTSWGRGKPLRGFSKFKLIVDRELTKAGTPIVKPWTLHDLRRTGASHLRTARFGIDERVVEEILGHVTPGILGRYQCGEFLPEKREALDRWAEYLTSLSA
jgi:integrase